MVDIPPVMTKRPQKLFSPRLSRLSSELDAKHLLEEVKTSSSCRNFPLSDNFRTASEISGR